ncbi:hypothetical protein GGR53DRAFT_323701 [Hypoxylon sp. FL1150]|nr:hypothetical protein GGR53DRAFT_323701 [Hypoxylon sp. FL1150]
MASASWVVKVPPCLRVKLPGSWKHYYTCRRFRGMLSDESSGPSLLRRGRVLCQIFLRRKGIGNYCGLGGIPNRWVIYVRGWSRRYCPHVLYLLALGGVQLTPVVFYVSLKFYRTIGRYREGQRGLSMELGISISKLLD